MANENEPAKLLLPYLQRADELQKHEPLVAYYCRLYAMERGLKIAQSGRTKTISSLLISLMNQLEKDKKSLKLGHEDGLYLEGFASNVFAKADKQDRAGRADLNTAKTFYAASSFFEILSQFGDLLPDLEQKQKYAGWKAADIRKALKEGRKPEPGPPSDHENMSGIPSTTNGSYGQISTGISSSKSSHSSTGYSSPDFHPSSHKSEKSQYSPEPPLHFPPQEHEQFFPEKYTSRETSVSPEPSPTPAPTYQYDSNYLPPPEKIIEAHKAAKFAVGALAFNDVTVAVDFLKQSLELLTNPSAGQ